MPSPFDRLNDLPPRTWPEGTVPEAEPFLDWLLACPRWYQLRMLSGARSNAHIAGACFQENHPGMLIELEHAREALATAWKRGYDQCRDDAEQAIMAAIDRDRNKTADGMDARHAGPHS